MNLSFVTTPTQAPTSGVDAVFIFIVREQFLLLVDSEQGWRLPGGALSRTDNPGSVLSEYLRQQAGIECSAPIPLAIGLDDETDLRTLYLVAPSQSTRPAVSGRVFRRGHEVPVAAFIEQSKLDRVALRRLLHAAQAVAGQP